MLVALCVEPLLKQLLSQKSRLGHSIYVILHLNVDISLFGCLLCKLLLIDNFLRDVSEIQLHILLSWQRCVEVEVADVNAHELCSLG